MSTTDDTNAARRGSESNDLLGRLAARRGELRARANIAIWGCIVCSNVWSASEGGPMKFLLGAVWLVFAAMILWIERDVRKA